MKKLASWRLRVTILMYAFLHFFTAFFEISSLIDFLAIVGVLIFFFAIFHITVAKFKLPIFIFIIGIVILIYADYPILDGILNGTLMMRNMVGLLIIVPI